MSEQHRLVFDQHVMPINIFLNPDLSPAEKILWTAIRLLESDKGWCTATNRYLGYFTNLNHRTIGKLVDRLEAGGFLMVEPISDKRAKRRTIYKTDTVVVPSAEIGIRAAHDKVFPERNSFINVRSLTSKGIVKRRDSGKNKASTCACAITYTCAQVRRRGQELSEGSGYYKATLYIHTIPSLELCYNNIQYLVLESIGLRSKPSSFVACNTKIFFKGRDKSTSQSQTPEKSKKRRKIIAKKKIDRKALSNIGETKSKPVVKKRRSVAKSNEEFIEYWNTKGFRVHNKTWGGKYSKTYIKIGRMIGKLRKGTLIPGFTEKVTMEEWCREVDNLALRAFSDDHEPNTGFKEHLRTLSLDSFLWNDRAKKCKSLFADYWDKVPREIVAVKDEAMLIRLQKELTKALGISSRLDSSERKRIAQASDYLTDFYAANHKRLSKQLVRKEYVLAKFLVKSVIDSYQGDLAKIGQFGGLNVFCTRRALDSVFPAWLTSQAILQDEAAKKFSIYGR